jgi:hypothetical protein
LATSYEELAKDVQGTRALVSEVLGIVKIILAKVEVKTAAESQDDSSGQEPAKVKEDDMKSILIALADIRLRIDRVGRIG